MRTKKTFDCVQMKWDIQRKLRDEECGLSLAGRQALMKSKLSADPSLDQWVQRTKKTVLSGQTAFSCVADEGSVYTKVIQK